MIKGAIFPGGFNSFGTSWKNDENVFVEICKGTVYWKKSVRIYFSCYFKGPFSRFRIWAAHTRQHQIRCPPPGLLFHETWFQCERDLILPLRKNSQHYGLIVPLWFARPFCKLVNNGLFCTRCNQKTQVEHTKSNYSVVVIATWEIIGHLCLVIITAKSSGSNKIKDWKIVIDKWLSKSCKYFIYIHMYSYV